VSVRTKQNDRAEKWHGNIDRKQIKKCDDCILQVWMCKNDRGAGTNYGNMKSKRTEHTAAGALVLAAGAATGIGSRPIGLLWWFDDEDDEVDEDDEEAEAVALTLRRCMADRLLRLAVVDEEDEEDDSEMVASGADEIDSAPLRAELGGRELAEDEAAPLPVASFSFSALKLKLGGVTLGRMDGL
jgi:hypothetical protein